MKIGDLSRVSGVPSQTIRFYERRGLLSPSGREGNGYRRYDHAAASRLDFIRSAQTAGLTLAEISSVITIRDAGEAPCAHVSMLLAAKLDAVRRRQEELALLEAELRQLIAEGQTMNPTECDAGGVCDVINGPRP
ncbi:heavy metal-responsive transcriptional regulator [Microcella sp.]|uniref:heavy metal-responsive transcriptional regulator n=1 Tax=Microcella sp. TaxID=1913979 RepID=UPI00391A784C